ncbi:MAG TPA: response regulator [Candidatus Portnoybacteria bacterium]|nr:response regulator [Candidatus Portnoybacteria bacterium]
MEKQMANEKKKILVVDDDEETRQMYAEKFTEEGFEVLEAKDGLEALDLATKELPDVIFTGIVMPRMDGWGLMEALQKHVQTNRIPVLVSSHLGREKDRKKAQELGAKDFVVRGYVSLNEVIERVRNLFGGERYQIAIKENTLDAVKFKEKFQGQCAKCGQEKVLALRPEKESGQFRTSLVCPKCG